MLNSIKELSWDSHFWQEKIGSLDIGSFYDNNDIKDELKGYAFVQALVPIEKNDVVLKLNKLGFSLADLRVTLSKKIINTLLDNSDLTIKKLSLEDESSSLDIIKGQFTKSRYLKTNIFSSSKVEDFYKVWIHNAILGLHDNECLGAFSKDKLIAVCSLKFTSSVAQIGLFGVHSSVQGKGVGKDFLIKIHNYLLEKSFNELSVVTQGENINAIKLYNRAGFELNKYEYWLQYEGGE
jgi:dTDP-4-amino-4,6-dideoxy-D-galactose acyltransferase